eukprot:comp17715_c0_seq2/m.17628 comp17715_c0_seq2/g.17628  ORF comp17715_c0_seq2/g.17628 comp17715_c0_seq2/m.17628 type:complete len:508 (-) comp17715_c0_seq2:374-1897(-)
MSTAHTHPIPNNGQNKTEPKTQTHSAPENTGVKNENRNVALLTKVTQYIDAHLQEHIHYHRNEDVPGSEFAHRAKLKAVVTQVKRPYQPSARPPGTGLVALEGPLLLTDTMPTPSLLQMTSPGRTLLVVNHVSPMSRLMKVLGGKRDAAKGGLEISVCGVKTEAGASEWLTDHLIGRTVNIQLIAPDRGGALECMVWYRPKLFGRKRNIAVELLSEGLGRAKGPSIFPPVNSTEQQQTQLPTAQTIARPPNSPHSSLTQLPPSTDSHGQHPTEEETTVTTQTHLLSSNPTGVGVDIRAGNESSGEGAGPKAGKLFSGYGIHGSSDILSEAIRRKSENSEKSGSFFGDFSSKFKRLSPVTQPPPANRKPQGVTDTSTSITAETKTVKIENKAENTGALHLQNTDESMHASTPKAEIFPSHQPPTSTEPVELPQRSETPDLIGAFNHRYARQDAAFVLQCVRAEMGAQKAKRGWWGIEPPKPNPAMRVPVVPRLLGRITRAVRSFIPRF